MESQNTLEKSSNYGSESSMLESMNSETKNMETDLFKISKSPVSSENSKERDNAEVARSKVGIEEHDYCTKYTDKADDTGKTLRLPAFSTLKKREEENYNSLNDAPQRVKDDMSTCNVVGLLLLPEIDQVKVEEIQEVEESIVDSIKFEVEMDDNANGENYEVEEEINKEPKNEDKTLTNGKIVSVEPLEPTTKNEKDASSQADGAFSRVCFCMGDLSLLGEDLTIKLEECNHTICSGCMTELLKSIVAGTTVEARCPRIINSNDMVRCNSLIQEHQIRKLVEPNLYEAYLEKSIIKIKEDSSNWIINCQTPTCQAWYIMEDNRVETFLCILCKAENVVNIKVNEISEENTSETDEYIISERYNEILLLSESDIVPNFESFECPVCLIEYEPQEGLILKNCLHTFCKTCIKNVILHSEDAEIKCPYKNDDYSCDETILQSEIKAVLQPDDFQKYLQKSIAQVERKAGKSAFHCKTPNCPGWCFYEPTVDHFLCPTCKEDNCFLCQKIHTGRGCFDPNSDDADAIAEQSNTLIDTMLEAGTAMRCPTCKAVITKAEGCDAVTCSSCKTEICWVTRGPRWGPNGKGDRSGGCKCETWARCHPMCKNCH